MIRAAFVSLACCLPACWTVAQPDTTPTSHARAGRPAAVLPPWVRAPDGDAWRRVTDDPERHKLQIVVTRVHRAQGSAPLVETWRYRDGAEYTYPASTIKLLAAVAALERLNELNASRRPADPPLTLDTRWIPITDADGAPDAASAFTLRRAITELFVVSDNPAFNRLYDFVGRTSLNERALAWGLASARVTHRLAIARTREQNRATPALVAFSEADEVLHRAPAARCGLDLSNTGKAGLRVGSARISNGERLEEPIDFTFSNAITPGDLQALLMAIAEPGTIHPPKTPNLTAAQRAFLLEVASLLPRENDDPIYDPQIYGDDHVKFLLPGLIRVAPTDTWRITNKIGLAYGFVTENARVEHLPTGRSLYIAATLYNNPNDTMNDNAYGYEDTQLAFMADLGEAIGLALAAPAEAIDAD